MILYHAITCAEEKPDVPAECDPTCAIGDPRVQGGRDSTLVLADWLELNPPPREVTAFFSPIGMGGLGG